MPQTDPYAAIAQPLPAQTGDPYAALEDHTQQGTSPDYPKGTETVSPTMGQIGKGALREIPQLASGAYGFGRQVLDLIPGIKNSQFGKDMEAHQQTLDAASKPANIGEAMGKTLPQMASYLLPAKGETALTEAAPEAMRPLARIATSALSSGGMNAMNNGSFGTGAAVGAGMGAAGELARGALAPALMRTAIPGNIGRDTANTLLRETKGVRPSTVLRSTESRIGQASGDLDTAVKNAPQTPDISLQPAIQPVQDALSTAQRQRAIGDSQQLQNVVDFLHGHGQYGPSRHPMLTPSEALDARRGFGREFLSNRQWNQVVNGPVLGPVKKGYGGITGELHAKVPGSIEADELIHNLKPGQEGLRKLVKADPSIVGNISGRLGARTGALTAAAMGAAGGARSAGLPGAILGGVTGLTMPEVLSAPAAKMALARSTFSTLTPKIGRAIATPEVQKMMDYLKQRRTGGPAQ